MKLYRKIDTTTGLFIEDVLLDGQPVLTQPVTQTIIDERGLPQEVITEQPILDAEGNTIPDPQYIDVECPAGFYRPKWSGTAWVEGLTPEEVATRQPVPQPDPDAELAAAITAATTLDQLKSALLGKSGIAKVKGRHI
jgi:hypothetical protein